MTTDTTTTVEFEHILTEDFLLLENFHGNPIYAKAGTILRTAAKANKLEDYRYPFTIRNRDEILPRIPGNLVKLVQVTRTTTRTVEREDLVA